MSAEVAPQPQAANGRVRQALKRGAANPVLAKELRGRMRGWRSTILMTVYLGMLAGVALLFYAISRESSSYSSPIEARVGQPIFYAIVVFQTVLVALLSPAFTAGIITGEREKQTFDVLMTTLLKPHDIIIGKLGAALAWLVLLVIAVIPLEAMAYVFGGVAPEEIIIANVVLLFAALLYGSVGIFWSTIARSTVAATVLSYATLLFFMAGVPAIWGIFLLLFGNNNYGSTAPRLEEQAWFIYASGMWLSINPFIALGLSAGFLAENRPLFIFVEDKMFNGQSLLILQPWLYFCIVAAIISVLLILWAVRVLPPTRRRAASRHPQDAPIPAALAAAPPTADLQISPAAEQTIAQREAANLSGQVRLRTDNQPAGEPGAGDRESEH